MQPERWIGLLGDDARPWLLESDEPWARFIALTQLFDRPRDDIQVRETRGAVLADPAVRSLIAALPNWEQTADFGGHNSPAFAPNPLRLLADMGVQAGDDPRIDRLIESMLEHQDADGLFESFGRLRSLPSPVWGSLPCDHHAITETLVRFGREEDPRVQAGLEAIAERLVETSQGRAWLCTPHTTTDFRGPGRKNDFCPQVTLEALRTLARLPESRRPPGAIDAARTSLRAWRARGEEKPYMFGHGRQFKRVKWPNFWYDVSLALDALTGYPKLWRGAKAAPEDRGSLAELAACLVAYNFGPDGRVTPKSCYRGFSRFSFGQKKLPSPFATARLYVLLRRLEDLAGEIGKIDVLELGSSKGGTGKPLPPAQ